MSLARAFFRVDGGSAASIGCENGEAAQNQQEYRTMTAAGDESCPRVALPPSSESAAAGISFPVTANAAFAIAGAAHGTPGSPDSPDF